MRSPAAGLSLAVFPRAALSIVDLSRALVPAETRLAPRRQGAGASQEYEENISANMYQYILIIKK